MDRPTNPLLAAMLAGRLWPNGECWVGHLRRPGAMGLSNLRKNHKPSRGTNGITSHGRRTVRQGAFLLEELVGKSDLSFLTCTLPGKTMEQCREANEKWGEIVRRFIQEIRRELQRHDLPEWIVGCTEIQPKRFKDTGQPWPHLHVVFPGWAKGQWIIRPARANLLWARCCKAVIGGGLGDYLASTRIEPIKSKKGVGHYLSKYMTKGSSEITAVLEQTPDFPFPHQWHHCTHSLGDLIAKGTKSLVGNTAAWVIRLFQSEYPGCKVFAVISPEPTENVPHDAPMGYFGMLDPPLATRVIDYDNLQRGHYAKPNLDPNSPEHCHP